MKQSYDKSRLIAYDFSKLPDPSVALSPWLFPKAAEGRGFHWTH